MPDPKVAILVTATDQASKVFQKVQATGGKAGDFLRANWGKIALGAAAAGAAVEAFGRKAARQNEALEKAAHFTGQTSEALRQLAIDTANVTRPVELTISLFEQAGKQGLEAAEDLHEFAAFWDTVGDATGENAEELAKAGAQLRSMGIEASDLDDSLGALGLILNNTTGNVKGFLDFVGRAGPELRELGLNIDQSAAVLVALEKEFGLTARAARSEFTQAVIEAKGNMGEFLNIVGLSEETLASYTNEAGNSADTITKLADIHAEHYTILQKMQHWLSEVGLQYGKQIEKATTLAPLLIGLSTGLTAIMMAGPPVVAGLAAVNVQIVTLKESSILASTAVTGLQTALAGAAAFVVGWQIGSILAKKFEIVRKAGFILGKGLALGWELIKIGVEGVGITIAHAFEVAFNTVKSLLASLLSFASSKFKVLADLTGADFLQEWADKLEDAYDKVDDSISSTTDLQTKLNNALADNVAKIDDIKATSFDAFEGLSAGARQAKKDVKEVNDELDKTSKITWTAEEAWNAMMDTWTEEDLQPWAHGLMDGVVDGMEESIPDFYDVGEDVTEELASGIKDSESVFIDTLQGSMDSAVEVAETGARSIGNALDGITYQIQVTKDEAANTLAGIYALATGVPAEFAKRAIASQAQIATVLPGLQHGGIAMSKQAVVVAENEPELITPLSKLGSLLGVNQKAKAENHFHFEGPFMGTPSEARIFAREILRYIDEERGR